MRVLIVTACLVSAPTVAQEISAIVPLQMPDGSKLWRYSAKEFKGDGAEILTIDSIAQALARVSWCTNGWEETKRTAPARGFVLIEGKCK